MIIAERMERVLIIGNCGAGKSTFARELAKQVKLPVIHLDSEYWKPGWIPMSDEEFDSYILGVLKQPRWIIDGNYKRTLPLRMKYADTIIFLDYPRWLSLFRAVRRFVLAKTQQRSELQHGNPERLRWKFLKWIITYPRKRTLQTIQDLLRQDQQLYILKSPQSANTFISRKFLDL
jgi:adenylate kinase family enzyme